MSKDIIYREDAIKAMEQRYQDILRIFKRKVKDGEKAIALDMIGCIKTLPSADRLQGEWIPCSERLPKSYVEVLVCDDYGWINLGAYRPCDVSEDCSGWSIHAHTKTGTEDVIAWMPLPKPWKGAENEVC